MVCVVEEKFLFADRCPSPQACVHAQSCPTLCGPLDCSLPGSSVHGIFPGKKSGVGRYFFLQGIFPTQELNLRFLLWQADSTIELPGKSQWSWIPC